MDANNFLSGSSNADYHGNRSHLSSSNLKMILTDIERFHHEWVLGNKPATQEAPHFDEGSFIHTLLLEPEKVGDYAVFEGLRKAGKAYEDFKEANKGKIILSVAQTTRCEKLAQAALRHKVATQLLSGGLPEHTLLGSVLDVPVKMRADYIVPGKYIVDVKTTSSPSDPDFFKASIEAYGYDLSAALYCQIAFENFKALHPFYWVVLSKADGGCMVYKASSETLSRGAAFVTQAIVKYKKCLEKNIWTDDAEQNIIEEVVEV